MNQTYDPTAWPSANQQYLMDYVRRILRILASRLPAEASAQFGDLPEMPAWTLEPTRALDQLVELFDLSPFERDVLLLCAARRECGKLEKSLTNCNLYEE